MQEIKNQAQALVEEYNSRLTELGVKIELSKKYFEATVEKRDTYHPQTGANLLNDALAVLDEIKERKYKRERNKYHCLILSLRPTDPKALPRELCKEYAFLLRKVEREHIGIAPEKVVYEENKILASVEKRLQKILKKAKKAPRKRWQRTLFGMLCDIAPHRNTPTSAKFGAGTDSSGTFSFSFASPFPPSFCA